MPTPTKPTPEQLAELRSQHPRAKALDVDLGDSQIVQFVMRPAKRGEYQAFRAKAKVDDAKAIENLVTACTLFPSREDLLALSEEYVAIFDALADTALALSGLTKSVEKKTD